MLSKIKNNTLVKGAFILTIAGIVTRIIGFFFRIFLSRCLGTVSLGLYQLVLPVSVFGLSVAGFGIQTAITRFVGEANSEGDAGLHIQRRILFQGTCLSAFIGIIIAVIIYEKADILSTYIFQEKALVPLVKIISVQIPLSAIHCCINGYFIGKKNTMIPGTSQIAEQLGKVIFTFLLWKYCLKRHTVLTPSMAITGAIAGEFCAVVFCLCSLLLCPSEKNHFSLTYRKNFLPEIVKLSAPLTINRVFLTTLSSIEAILIPYMLQIHGLSSKAALSIYGIFTGMALTFIFFPSTIINSISAVLLPEVAQLSCSESDKMLSETVSSTLLFCTNIGIFFTGLFATYGGTFAGLLFGEPDAGNYVKILAWLCPFMYLNINLSSTLHGLGKATTPFFINVTGSIIKIFFILFFMPGYGMTGYLMGLLISTMAETLLFYHALSSHLPLYFHAFSWIIRPFTDTAFSIVFTYIASILFSGILKLLPELIYYAMLCATSCICYLALSFYRSQKS